MDLKKPESFKGLRIGNLIGEGIPDQLREIATKKDFLEVQSIATVKSLFQMFANNRIDMIAINRYAGLTAMMEYLSKAQQNQIDIHPDRFRLSLYRLVVSNKFKARSIKLLQKFNMGLVARIRSGGPIRSRDVNERLAQHTLEQLLPITACPQKIVVKNQVIEERDNFFPGFFFDIHICYTHYNISRCNKGNVYVSINKTI